jgi:hypothetical protein
MDNNICSSSVSIRGGSIGSAVLFAFDVNGKTIFIRFKI